jgi:hypothetical protein
MPNPPLHFNPPRPPPITAESYVMCSAEMTHSPAVKRPLTGAQPLFRGLTNHLQHNLALKLFLPHTPIHQAFNMPRAPKQLSRKGDAPAAHHDVSYPIASMETRPVANLESERFSLASLRGQRLEAEPRATLQVRPGSGSRLHGEALFSRRSCSAR